MSSDMAEGRGALMSFKLLFLDLSENVFEYSCEDRSARTIGASSSENAGMSNEKVVKTHLAESLRVPPLCQSSEG